MRANFMSRLGRAPAAIAVCLATLVGVASAADAQTWNNGWVPNNGYNSPRYPYYQRSQDPGWTWGDRYGAPPSNTYYSGRGYSAQQQPYPQQRYNNNYNANPQLGPLNGLFAK